MIDLTLLIAGGSALATAFLMWLLMFLLARGAHRRAREEGEARIEAVQQQSDLRDDELRTLRDELRRELEQRAKAEGKAQQVEALQREVETLRRENVTLREQAMHLQTTLAEQGRQGEEKLKLLVEAREQLGVQFKNLANEILEDKSKRFTETNKTNLDGLLTPLKEQIKDFEKKVNEAYDKETRDRVGLFNEITRLKELNQKISQDAINLTKALKGDNKAQGIWGELILSQVLEKSGLTEGREYEVQASLTAEDGRRQQPDVIVRLPEGRHVIIDSKVSLVAYERFCSAEDELDRKQAIKEHCLSLRTHYKSLSAKAYQDLGLRTLDYVLMFLPVEAAYVEAVREDTGLFGDALERNIVIVTPSTLLATLRTIQNIWRFEHQNRHASEIADRAGKLYDKFVGFVGDLDEVGRRLAATQKTYDEAYKKLSTGPGNLVRRTEQLKELGAKAGKSLPAELLESAGSEPALTVISGGED